MGLIKQVIVAGAFGASIETDLISLSEGLTANIEYVIVQTLITALVPIYIHTREKNEAAGERLISDTINMFAVLSAALAALIVLLAPLIAKVIAPTYSRELSSRLANYLRLFSPVLIFYCFQAIFHAVLNANERFVPGQLVGLNQSLIIILLTLLFGKTLGPNTLALAFLIYPLFNAVFLGTFSKKYFRYRIGRPHLSHEIKSLLRMMGPLLLGYAAIFINQQIDKIIVSGMEEGTVTAMNYGAMLSVFVTSLFGAIASVIYTRLLEKVAAGENNAASAFAINSAGMIGTVILPISIITICCSKDIVAIVFQRGAFDGKAVQSAASALAGYGFMFVPHFFKDIFSRLQYGHKNSKKPMLNNTIGIAFNSILSILLYKRLGVFGVTLASSAADFVSASLNMLSSKRAGMVVSYRPILRYLPIWLVGGILCAVFAAAGTNWFDGWNAIARFGLTTLISGGVYAAAAFPVLKEVLRNR